jgi:hypothetical protein
MVGVLTKGTKMKVAKVTYFTESGKSKKCEVNSEKWFELHTCPFREDVNGDNQTLCDCGDVHTNNCAEDI